MLVLKSKLGESFHLEGYGVKVFMTPVEIREFEVSVCLVYGSAEFTFAMDVNNPLVIRLGDADVEIWVERLFGQSVRFSFEAPPVIAIFRLCQPVSA